MQKKRSYPPYARTPTVYQMEATECGAASLAMICGYYGRTVPLEQMRIETGVSRDGCNAKNMLRAARKFGLEAKGYRKSLDALLQLKPPCILHWNFNHFVVWEGMKGKTPCINDPAVGRRKLTLAELDEGYTGVVLTFAPTAAFRKEKSHSPLAAFLRQRLRGQWQSVAGLVVIGLCLAAPGLVLPGFSRIFIDEILLGGNRSWLPAFLTAMGFTLVFQAVLGWYRSTVLLRFQTKMALLGAYRFLHHLLRLPIAFFDQRYAGDLATRVANNNAVSDFLAGDLAATALNLLVAVFYLLLMVIYSPLLTLIGLASVAVNLVLLRCTSRMLANTAMKQQQDQGKLVGAVYAGLSLTSTLKASGAENQYVARILGHYARNARLEQRNNQLQQILNVVPGAVGSVSGVLVLMAGGVLVIRGQMTAGMLVAFGALQSCFVAPASALLGVALKTQTLRADMARVNDILRYPPDPRYCPETPPVPLEQKLTGEVELRGISFGYSLLEPPLVQDFSFHLSCGSSIAFVGASGSGKSTAAKIVSGLYAPWSGQVLLDGIPLERIPPQILHCSVATVSQKITLFSGTIRENLTLWNRSVLEQDMVRAAKDACIHDVISRLPGGYDYRLAEGGSNLSGGQRQRLEIARALVTEPSILIMDEATSALDPLVEKQIVDNIKRRGCSCIMVAHRLSAIRDCDEILVMEEGRIVQRGTHDQLKDRPGTYRQLIQNF